MPDMAAVLASVVFCAAGSFDVDKKCPDGAPPLTYEMSIFRGDIPAGPLCESTDMIICKPKPWNRLDSVIEIKQDGRILFVLKPDGSVEQHADFNPLLGAKAFWLAVFAVYEPTAYLWAELKDQEKSRRRDKGPSDKRP